VFELQPYCYPLPTPHPYMITEQGSEYLKKNSIFALRIEKD
jgi:hypothetical protein